MVRRLAWILTLPLALLAISFAATNRGGVEVGLWPLPFYAQIPLYGLVLGAFVIGFLVGGSLMWLRTAPRLWQARRTAKQVVKLEKTVAEQVKTAAVLRHPELAGANSPAQLVDASR
jgi:uncharacterized integral membrane protein